MQGRPFLRVLALAFGFLLIGWPVWRVTHSPTAEAAAAPAAPAAPTAALTVRVGFAHPPASFVLLYLGHPVLEGKGSAELSGPWTVALPAEGADLLLKASWPPGVPRTAAEVRVSRGPDVLADRTFWGRETLTEIVFVPGHP